MKIELAKTGDKRWWPESGASSWGLGIEVVHFGSEHWDEPTDTQRFESEGHSTAILIGPWSLIFHSEAAFRATHGGEMNLYKTFEVVRP